MWLVLQGNYPGTNQSAIHSNYNQLYMSGSIHFLILYSQIWLNSQSRVIYFSISGSKQGMRWLSFEEMTRMLPLERST